ncbi:MAG: hydroxymethylglutaryl-CoA lyase, partial [Pseudomonadota bacterium]|nr:hydroxymethylglutaryl-CoA lyase [Pseudomonadota bacterium]
MNVDSIDLHEVGPREGFQFEGIGRPDFASVEDKVRLITALTTTGAKTIEATSFVSPKAVPQMADADEITRGLPDTPGVAFTALHLNAKGLQRIFDADRYAVEGRIMFTASETFARHNQNRTHEQDIDVQRACSDIYT